MDGITKDSIKTAKLMKQLWPQLTDKEAIDEVKRYTNGKILQSLLKLKVTQLQVQHYVHSDLIMLKVVNIVLLDSQKGIIVDEEYRLKDIAKKSLYKM